MIDYSAIVVVLGVYSFYALISKKVKWWEIFPILIPILIIKGFNVLFGEATTESKMEADTGGRTSSFVVAPKKKKRMEVKK